MTVRFFLCAIVLLNSYSSNIFKEDKSPHKQTSYYFSVNGNDKNDGSKMHPFRSLAHLSALRLNPGDSILLKSGDKFEGSILLNAIKNNNAEKPILLTSYGNGKAIINAGNGSAIEVNESSFIVISNITCKGSGRKNGNTKAGILINHSASIDIANIEVSGFQKSGLQVYNCKNINVDKVNAHDNGAAGIGIDGDYGNKLATQNIRITNCCAVNNPGDPTNLTNHSGDGIVVGDATNVLIDHCMATDNGWDMPRIGNGPVGIWCYEADSVIIQHCLSYGNKTSVGAEDGGGYDFDGGVTNSIIQYCLSYNNQGGGYCMFQYAGASPWYNNVIRFNISINDGSVSTVQASIYTWNGSRDSGQFYNCDFYNNTIYNSKKAVLSYAEDGQRKNFRFFNNIFIGKDSLIRGDKNNDIFLANDWWSLDKKFNADGMNDFNAWISKNNIEQIDSKVVGLSVLPLFKNADDTTFTDVKNISRYDSYKIIGASPVTQSGIDLRSMFNIDVGKKDFNDKPVNTKYIGACTH